MCHGNPHQELLLWLISKYLGMSRLPKLHLEMGELYVYYEAFVDSVDCMIYTVNKL